MSQSAISMPALASSTPSRAASIFWTRWAMANGSSPTTAGASAVSRSWNSSAPRRGVEDAGDLPQAGEAGAGFDQDDGRVGKGRRPQCRTGDGAVRAQPRATHRNAANSGDFHFSSNTDTVQLMGIEDKTRWMPRHHDRISLSPDYEHKELFQVRRSANPRRLIGRLLVQLESVAAIKDPLERLQQFARDRGIESYLWKISPNRFDQPDPPYHPRPARRPRDRPLRTARPSTCDK